MEGFRHGVFICLYFLNLPHPFYMPLFLRLEAAARVPGEDGVLVGREGLSVLSFVCLGGVVVRRGFGSVSGDILRSE